MNSRTLTINPSIFFLRFVELSDRLIAVRGEPALSSASCTNATLSFFLLALNHGQQRCSLEEQLKAGKLERCVGSDYRLEVKNKGRNRSLSKSTWRHN